MSLVQQLI